MSKYLALLDTISPKSSGRKTPTSSTFKTFETPFEGFEGGVSRGVDGINTSFEGFEGDCSRHVSEKILHIADVKKGLLNQPSNPSKATNDAATAVAWLRSHGVAVTLSEDARRPVLSGEKIADIPSAYLNRVHDLAADIVALLDDERKSADAARKRYKNSEAWNWPTDLDDAIRIAGQRNKAIEKRRETARYCPCQRLAENEWATPRGRLWICEPCRHAGLLEQLQEARS